MTEQSLWIHLEGGMTRQRGPKDGPRVVEACRQKGKLFVTLQYTHVGTEYNRVEEIYLDEIEAHQLLADLKEVCEGL